MSYLNTLLFILLTSLSVQAQNALNFDGSDDVVTSVYSGPLGSTNRTFEAWVYVSPSAPASNLCILDYGSNAVGSRNTFNVTGSRALSFISGGTNANISSSPNDITVGQWTHVAFVLNNGVGFLYVDGVQVGMGNLSTVNTPGGNQYVQIGERVNGGSIPFYGSIDEVRVWNVARTQAEILGSMNDEICNANLNLRLNYRFNEGVANGTNSGVQQATDASGNWYTGILNNFALSGTSSNWTNGFALTPGSTSTTVIEQACENYTWSANGQTFTASGIYNQILTGVTGCDSAVILNLSIYSPSDQTTNQVACESYTWPVNGQTYTSSDTIVENLTTSQGCPYQHTLNVTINNGYDTTIYDGTCDSLYFEPLGAWLSIPGQYIYNGTAANGCDSTITMALEVGVSPNVDIAQNGDGSLSTTYPFQLWWYDCINDSIISGASQINFMPTYNSSYAAIGADWMGITCKDTSDCIVVDYLSAPSVGPINHGITIEPNPTDGDFEISVDAMHGWLVFEIYDASGKVIQSRTIEGGTVAKMKLEAEPGVYMVRALTEFSWYTERIIKL